MFWTIFVIVTSLLKASTCFPSAPIKNDLGMYNDIINDNDVDDDDDDDENIKGGTRCYSCPNVEEPYLCNVTTQCRPDEQCYTEEYSTNNGGSIFSVGCRRIADCYVPFVGRSVSSRRDVNKLTCEECCRGNLCNDGGCSAGIGKGNVCYSCNLLQDPRQCNQEKRCQSNERCYIEKVYTRDYDIKFNLGCVENAECQRLRQFGLPVGKRDQAISTMCASCCYGDRCNDACFLNGSLATTRPLVTTDTIGVNTTGGSLYTSVLMNIHTTPVYTTSLESSSSPSTTTDTTIAASANPLMNTDSTFLYTTILASSSSFSATTDTTSALSSVNPLMNTYTTSSPVDTTTASSAIPSMSSFVHTTRLASSLSPSTIIDTAGLSSPTSLLMDIDTTPVDTASRMSSIGPSKSTDVPVLYTASGTTSMSPSVGTDSFVHDTASATPSISPSVGTDTFVHDTATATPSIRPLMSTDATVVATTIETSSPNPPRISTAFVDSSVKTSTATTLSATFTLHELSTVTHGVTASPSTSTTQSMLTHGTSPGNELSIICHADCDGKSGCILPKIQTCSGTTPYCFTQVDNTDSGDFNIKKSCADRTTCNTKWWQQTSDDSRCVNYKPGIMDTFSCFYCCTVDTCNLDNIQPSSPFIGDE